MTHEIICITDKFQKFDFDTLTWKELPFVYPFPVVLPTLVWMPTKGELFAFGGYGYYFAWKTSNIYKRKSKHWNYFGSMSYSSRSPLVVPYVNKVVIK